MLFHYCRQDFNSFKEGKVLKCLIIFTYSNAQDDFRSLEQCGLYDVDTKIPTRNRRKWFPPLIFSVSNLFNALENNSLLNCMLHCHSPVADSMTMCVMINVLWLADVRNGLKQRKSNNNVFRIQKHGNKCKWCSNLKRLSSFIFFISVKQFMPVIAFM